MNKNCDHPPMKLPFILGYAESHVKMSKYRAIFLSEEITKSTASELSALLLYMDNKEQELPIQIYINSPGGCASSLIQILATMEIIKSPVHTIVVGKAYSAGAILLSAGNERYALPSSKIMLHGVQYGFPIPGNDLTDNKSYYSFVNQSNDVIMKLMSKYTKQPLEKLKQDLSRELWLTATDAVAYGVIDGII